MTLPLPRPLRLSTAAAATVLAALIVPLTAVPSHAGAFCGTPLEAGDCTPPDTEITGHPEATTDSREATFTFGAEDQDATDKATFECRLQQGDEVVQDWTDCTDSSQTTEGRSTGTETFSGLDLGSYTFSARATDTPDAPLDQANTEDSPATFGWTIVEPPDTTPPETVITAGARRWHPFSFLGINYRSDEAAAGFVCALNGRERDCEKQQAVFYGMNAGDYRFTVAAVDDSGNVDPTPARERWTVPMNNTLFKKHSRQWDRRTGSGHFQDTYSITDQRGAFLEQGKRGFRSLVLVATRCRGCGKVAVELRGDLVATVDLAARKTRKRQVIPIGSWRRAQSGQVRLELVSRGKDVLIEGLGFSRRR